MAESNVLYQPWSARPQVTFQQNLLPSLAVYDDNTFDSAMCNLVSPLADLGGVGGFGCRRPGLSGVGG